jgi:predicted DsbA family dithiol-disulfide isomerase
VAITLRIFSDFTCPFCYLGIGVIEQLMREVDDIQVEWVCYELHPEVPEAGMPLAEKFPEYDLDALFEELRVKGARYGYEFAEVTLLSNSRKALEASEFARDRGKHAAFHLAAFRAYFGEARDIGRVSVILDLAAQVGLNPEELLEALNEHRYADRLKEGREEGSRYNVSVLPTFVFNGREKIVGLRSIEVFRHMIRGLAHKPLLDQA